ncbi:MAG: helix-turn-helix transcriptional regulator [Propionibacteriaceae bacterium]|jgi:MerR family transcriptional regulator/heat shock protein HspR|nr:helix-turn-helix transcriptional regulator [Propionibacteriaceae bacterium]
MIPNGQLPQVVDQDAPLFLISTAARLAGMHPQTLRTWDRLGLVVPHRSKGRGRRYSARDVARLRLIQYLSQDEGINLNGIRRILELQADNEKMRREMSRLFTEITRLQASPANPGVFTASARGDVWTRIQPLGPRELMP